jgi:hypothetical protein
MEPLFDTFNRLIRNCRDGDRLQLESVESVFSAVRERVVSYLYNDEETPKIDYEASL